MYIQKIEIKNVRSIVNFEFELQQKEHLPGWHVLIGDNGSGKSSVLRSISLGLIGPRQALRLNPDWEEWLRSDTNEGSISLEVYYDRDFDRYSGGGQPVQKNIAVLLNLTRNMDSDKSGRVELNEFGSRDTTARKRAYNYIWGENKGWFSAGYGPFRRFSGSDAQNQSLMFTSGKVSAHASVFFESVALSNYREWLKNLDYTSSRGTDHEARTAEQLFQHIKEFINQDGFLPFETRLDAIVPTPNGTSVVFVDGNGNHVNIEQLGDGYRSILSMTLELIRQMTLTYEIDQVFDPSDPTKIGAPGVVLVDEIDAHLHPEWQRRIGFWLIEHFPKIQFIVTTHSPLVCQAASSGSIWRLPAPGSQQQSYQVESESEEWKRLVYGNILEAYSTDLFGENIDRSPEAQEKLDRVAALSAKELDEPLTNLEEKELRTLMDELPSTPYRDAVGLSND